MSDLGQDPRHRQLHTRNGNLNTIISGAGVNMIPYLDRALTASEAFTAHGWPITDACVEAASSTECHFSHSHPVPA
eukprot:8522300-Alexandrium_andersonii.AAC.1